MDETNKTESHKDLSDVIQYITKSMNDMTVNGQKMMHKTYTDLSERITKDIQALFRLIDKSGEKTPEFFNGILIMNTETLFRIMDTLKTDIEQALNYLVGNSEFHIHLTETSLEGQQNAIENAMKLQKINIETKGKYDNIGI